MVWTIFENLNIEKIIFKVFQLNFWAMHITNQILSFDIFMVGNLLNIFMEHDIFSSYYSNYFWHKIKICNFDSYNVLLAIITNIAVLLMTAFVLLQYYLH